MTAVCSRPIYIRALFNLSISDRTLVNLRRLENVRNTNDNGNGRNGRHKYAKISKSLTQCLENTPMNMSDIEYIEKMKVTIAHALISVPRACLHPAEATFIDDSALRCLFRSSGSWYSRSSMIDCSAGM